MSDVPVAWQGEVMLLQWAESSTRGRTITFLLPEDEETHPFKDFSFKAGKRSGQRFMAVFVALTDDERPEERPLSQEAGALCKNPEFWRWADGRTMDTVDSEDSARQWLCEQLSISSRSQLGTDERAASAFRMLMAEFRRANQIFGRS
jgi:hypothetical protein